VLGIAFGVVAARVLASLVGPLPDLGVGQLTATACVLGVAMLLALVGPIHRAGRIQPVAVLRRD